MSVSRFFSQLRGQAHACIALVALLAVPAWAIPAIEHWQHASGAQIYLVRSPSIPMLDVQIDFDAGTRRVAAEQAGLASGMALLLGKGVQARLGQSALDENAIGQAWADLGARFGATASADRLSFSLRLMDKLVRERG